MWITSMGNHGVVRGISQNAGILVVLVWNLPTWWLLMAWCQMCTTSPDAGCLLQCSQFHELTHWGRVTHICISKLTIVGSDNGLSPGRRQAIIWTNNGILLIGPLGTHFSEILIEIYTYSFKKNEYENVIWKTMAILSGPQCVQVFKKLFSSNVYIISLRWCHCGKFDAIQWTLQMSVYFGLTSKIVVNLRNVRSWG